jgi:hypothetical protein
MFMFIYIYIWFDENMIKIYENLLEVISYFNILYFKNLCYICKLKYLYIK